MNKFLSLLDELESDFSKSNVEIDYLRNKFVKRMDKIDESDTKTNKFMYQTLILLAQENISLEDPDWTYVAARIYLDQMYEEAQKNRTNFNFYKLLERLIQEEVYDPALLNDYTKDEIQVLEDTMDFKKDHLFNYIGLHTLDTRYLASRKDGSRMEMPQERFMIIAMSVMRKEKNDRLEKVKEAYWALSNLYMTTATPTLSNAGKVDGQLSSCFIDTVGDDLRAIYDSNTDIAQISKNGGGVGVYMGKVRSSGSSIRGHKGASSGVISWMKQIDTTAVNVDQLGKRKGAVAVYLDVWHKDTLSFLDVKLNNGDSRMRTHDIFTGVCIPNLFMEKVEKREDWHLFDPHEVKEVMGFHLEDFYDEEKNDGTFRRKYKECVDNKELSRKTVPAIDIMKRIMISQLESGTPFMFYRDTVNQMNANSHEGIIYCSNLCTEITQNQSETRIEEEVLDDGKIIITKNPGDFVVCNLSSINLARAYPDNVLKRLIKIQVRMLDNTIDVNNLPILQSEHTNNRYRAIGLGTFGYHELLARNNIHWESEEAVNFSDSLYEEIAFHTIEASSGIAKEKEPYPLYPGSDWEDGSYFEKRGYLDKESPLNWGSLQKQVQEHGVRNAYLMAVAPNSSTSIIAGTTASIDPIFRLEYYEEKKDFKIPVTAPGYNENTKDYYKSAYDIDQLWSLKQNIKRQKHIDQSISFNLYVKNSIKAKDLLDFHLTAWKEGLKTTYYVRSTSQS